MKAPRKTVIAASTLAAMAAGGLFGATVLAPQVGGAAATTSTTAASSAQSQASYAPTAGNPSKGGHTANGITETVLTGDKATKATAAATAAVPGGTLERVETDAEGATYEAHVTKADGSQVTVKLDANFKVTSIEQGHA
jgi:uncharacterized membrane protein YkoI